MVILRPALRISGCAQGSSELSYRQVAARDYRVPEGINRHSVIVANLGLGDVLLTFQTRKVVSLRLDCTDLETMR